MDNEWNVKIIRGYHVLNSFRPMLNVHLIEDAIRKFCFNYKCNLNRLVVSSADHEK